MKIYTINIIENTRRNGLGFGTHITQEFWKIKELYIIISSKDQGRLISIEVVTNKLFN